MSEHFTPQGIQGEGQFRLRICGAVTVEPGAEILKTKGA
jgi:hypothetical protein